MKTLASDTIAVFKRCQQQAEDANDRALLGMQIEALKGIREVIGVYGKMQYKMVSFEKLLCDPWMKDESIFNTVYSSWDGFRGSFALEIGGMTVNERLCFLGLMDDYEHSCDNPSEMRAVLQATFLSQDNIEALIEKNLA